MGVNIIKGTDRNFKLRVTTKEDGLPFDFTGLTGTDLELKIPTDAGDMTLSLTPNANGSKLEIVSGLGGLLRATLSDIDTALLKTADGQNMELTIKEGAGPDFDISIVQFAGALNVKKSYFEA